MADTTSNKRPAEEQPSDQPAEKKQKTEEDPLKDMTHVMPATHFVPRRDGLVTERKLTGHAELVVDAIRELITTLAFNKTALYDKSVPQQEVARLEMVVHKLISVTPTNDTYPVNQFYYQHDGKEKVYRIAKIETAASALDILLFGEEIGGVSPAWAEKELSFLAWLAVYGLDRLFIHAIRRGADYFAGIDRGERVYEELSAFVSRLRNTGSANCLEFLMVECNCAAHRM